MVGGGICGKGMETEGAEKDRKFAREVLKVDAECGLEDFRLYDKGKATKGAIKRNSWLKAVGYDEMIKRGKGGMIVRCWEEIRSRE